LHGASQGLALRSHVPQRSRLTPAPSFFKIEASWYNGARVRITPGGLEGTPIRWIASIEMGAGVIVEILR
ncbi:MAG: hypothetical protein PVJ07_06485, partial [Anaerolineales bacterium]